ncbi:MAG: HD-GYP domain-containing protein [Desulfurella sp.]
MKKVADIAFNIAQALNLGNRSSMVIFKASLHHDVGKFFWYNDLFTKPNKLLNEQDKYYIFRHPEYSIQYLQMNMPKYVYKEYSKGDISAIDLIFMHHEKPDGSGYYRIKDIPKESAIVSVSDIFSACFEYRPYRKSIPYNIAVKTALQDYTEVFTEKEVETIKSVLKSYFS